MATKFTNRLKATVWSKDLKTELDGSIDVMLPIAFAAVLSSKRREKMLADMKRTHESMNGATHTCYKDGDENIPSQILDGNGQVVLDLCKVCGKAEVELLEAACSVKKEEDDVRG